MKNSAESISHQYLEALRQADLSSLLELFAPDAQVDSPLYGKQLATDFYRSLFQDTKASELEFLNIFIHADQLQFALYFRYHWTMENESKSSFEVVDIIELNEHGKINSLKIIYDTQHTRSAFDRLNQE